MAVGTDQHVCADTGAIDKHGGDAGVIRLDAHKAHAEMTTFCRQMLFERTIKGCPRAHCSPRWHLANEVPCIVKAGIATRHDGHRAFDRHTNAHHDLVQGIMRPDTRSAAGQITAFLLEYDDIPPRSSKKVRRE